jgi:hypothetical protein
MSGHFMVGHASVIKLPWPTARVDFRTVKGLIVSLTSNSVQLQAGTAWELARPAAEIRSARWFIRRTLIGVVALSVFMLGGAWLLHASIEPDGTQSEQSHSE